MYILQDHRVYEKAKVNSINYVKKINFDRYRPTCKESSNTLLYGTENRRLISQEQLDILSTKHNNIILLVNDIKEDTDNIKYLSMPVENLFDKFGTYVYTKVSSMFDCSPRFIAECKFYNKEVIYDIDYLEEDKGLYYRKQDLEDRFNSLYLKEDDSIIQIIKGII